MSGLAQVWLLWLLLLPVFWLAAPIRARLIRAKASDEVVTTQGESIVKDVPIEVPALVDTVDVPADLKDYEFDSTEDIIDGVVVKDAQEGSCKASEEGYD